MLLTVGTGATDVVDVVVVVDVAVQGPMDVVVEPPEGGFWEMQSGLLHFLPAQVLLQ